MFHSIRISLVTIFSVVICLYTLFEVNYARLQPQSALAIFVGLGLVLCFLEFPVHRRWKDVKWLRVFDLLLAIASALCCGYIVFQTQPQFEEYWAKGFSLGDRAGIETTTDFAVGALGLILVLEATRRSIGWIVLILSCAFIAHSYYCYLSFRFDYPMLPDWMLPHAGQSMKDIVSTTFLQSLGVFGPAASVMFVYVFLFVVFGAFLELSGATQFIIDFATKVFGRTKGGPAMMSVAASGLMGSLSGSAVANVVTTGTFTIPMMRSARFPGHVAGGIEAASASGGTLVPPVMGAGAYMMLELVQPEGGFVTIMRAAILPALLYYFSILTLVFLYSRSLNAKALEDEELTNKPLPKFEGAVFGLALFVLVGMLLMGSSPFKAVTGSLVIILVSATLNRKSNLGLVPRRLALASFIAVFVAHQFTRPIVEQAPNWLQPFLASNWHHPTTGELTARLLLESFVSSAIVGMFGLLIFGMIHPAWRPDILEAFKKSARNGASLVAVSACVGIIIGIVQQTGVANDFSAAIKDVVDTNLFLALVGIMFCSLILGMGVPSVVCYLLMATLMGSLLDELGVVPLAAHLFIFYFGMMSMVTPPVALAGYAAASIAGSPIMQTSVSAFRFALVGFTLPYMFVYRPALCLLAPAGKELTAFAVAHALLAAIIGIVALAAGLAGHLRHPLALFTRCGMFLAAALLLAPITKIGDRNVGLSVDIAGAVLFILILLINVVRGRRELQNAK